MKIQPAAVYQALRAAGFAPANAGAFVSIAERESNFNLDALNPSGEYSVGLWQINIQDRGNGPAMERLFNTDRAGVIRQLNTLAGSVKGVQSLSRGGTNFFPWGPYKGEPWNYNTNPNTGAAASGGETSVTAIRALPGYQRSRERGGQGADPLAGTAATGIVPAGIITDVVPGAVESLGLLGDIFGAVGDAALGPVEAVATALRAIAAPFLFLIDPSNWKRIGLFVLGANLLGLGLLIVLAEVGLRASKLAPTGKLAKVAASAAAK